mmetsp:Transcript_114047/g.271517  ORF Transcript_114047/g.271517 Transcript_114047/m.271517 type:complete len:224 (-) Transcript_114047:733-1404(-)
MGSRGRHCAQLLAPAYLLPACELTRYSGSDGLPGGEHMRAAQRAGAVPPEAGLRGYHGGPAPSAAFGHHQPLHGGSTGAAHGGAPGEPVLHGAQRAALRGGSALPVHDRVQASARADLSVHAVSADTEHPCAGSAAGQGRVPCAEDRAPGWRDSYGLRRVQQGGEGLHHQQAGHQERKPVRAGLQAGDSDPRRPRATTLRAGATHGHGGGEQLAQCHSDLPAS